MSTKNHGVEMRQTASTVLSPNAEFSIVSKIERQIENFGNNPEQALRHLLKIVRGYNSMGNKRSAEETQAAFAALEKTVVPIEMAVLTDFPDDFKINWLAGRFLHRMGHNKDALGFIIAADKLKSAVGEVVPAVRLRMAEVLGAMHSEIPTNGYGRDAFFIAVTATIQKPSAENIHFCLNLAGLALRGNSPPAKKYA